MKKRHVIENNSLKVWKDGKKALTLHPQKLASWSLRLSVRTRDFHSLKSNRYYAKTMRNAVRKLRAITDKDEAVKLYPVVQKMLDKLAKTNIIHANKAANIKSGLALHISKLG